MTQHADSPEGDNAREHRNSGVSTHPHSDAYRFTAEEWLARNDDDWGAAHAALQRLDGGDDA